MANRELFFLVGSAHAAMLPASRSFRRSLKRGWVADRLVGVDRVRLIRKLCCQRAQVCAATQQCAARKRWRARSHPLPMSTGGCRQHLGCDDADCRRILSALTAAAAWALLAEQHDVRTARQD